MYAATLEWMVTAAPASEAPAVIVHTATAMSALVSVPVTGEPAWTGAVAVDVADRAGIEVAGDGTAAAVTRTTSPDVMAVGSVSVSDVTSLPAELAALLAT
jgi:hypothetical protein